MLAELPDGLVTRLRENPGLKLRLAGKVIITLFTKAEGGHERLSESKAQDCGQPMEVASAGCGRESRKKNFFQYGL